MGIQKQVTDILEGAKFIPSRGKKAQKIAEISGAYRMEDIAPDEIWRTITKLEEKMFQHAKDLEFEEAARLRDEVGKLKEMAQKM